MATFDEWRAAVEKELAGKPFEKALVHQALEGIAVQPLYVEAPRRAQVSKAERSFRICTRQVADLDEGADAVWARLDEVSDEVLARPDAFFVFEPGGDRERLAMAKSPFVTVGESMVSTLRFHRAGATSVDELAIALSLGVERLEAGEDPKGLGFQISVGRDSFIELCKLRALRVCWSKVLGACGVREAPNPIIHAVCSTRTLTKHDPWVNMLRVTTQVFAGVLGGADLVTPNAFDGDAGSEQGRRVARNTGLVLREESHLGEVEDAAAGSYAFETMTDALARQAWAVFQTLDRTALDRRLEASWQQNLEAVAKRRQPIVGTSEFANLDEPAVPSAFGGHRDSEAFEALRAKATGSVELVALGGFAASRPRVGFASGFFAAGGLRANELESATNAKASIVCLCGSDETYAREAAAAAKTLKAKGVHHVVLAGRPGPLEAELRAAGVEAFIFVGSDLVATLSELLT